MVHQDIKKGDQFYNSLAQIIIEQEPKTILDIGASEGRGSTDVFKTYAKGAEIYAIELDPDRFASLKAYHTSKNVHLFEGSSCPANELMSADGLGNYFAQNTGWDCWRSVGYTEMKKWLKNTASDIKAIKTKYKKDLIPYIKKKHKIKTFDMVLVDGSPFTSKYEVEQIHGAKIIILDDVLDPKNNLNYKRLASGGDYWCIEVNKGYRNGYAIFQKFG